MADLAIASGSDLAFLSNVVDRVTDEYRAKSVRKKSGGVRILKVPSDDLSQFQRWFLKTYLNHVSLHHAAYAYRQGRSIGAAARRHLGASWVVRLDLQSFFDSIDERRVYYIVLKELNASPLLSFQLARLLTCPVEQAGDESSFLFAVPGPFWSQLQVRQIMNRAPHLLGHLPQGAPTSGALANMAAYPLDARLDRLARSNSLVYTRYADDMHFSAPSPRSRPETAKLIGLVHDHVRECHFTLNEKKTKVSGPGAAKRVLGLHVDGTALRISSRIRDQIDHELWALEKFGIRAHAAHKGHTDLTYCLKHVEGLIHFAMDVAPEWARVRLLRFDGILASQGLARSAKSGGQSISRDRENPS